MLCLIDVKISPEVSTNFFTFTSASQTTASHSLSFVSSSINVAEIASILCPAYCTVLPLPIFCIILCYLPPSLPLEKVEEICLAIESFTQNCVTPVLLLGDLNVPHPENSTAMSAAEKRRASFLQRFLRKIHFIPLGAQTEKRCVDWICASAAALYLVQEVLPVKDSTLGSLKASDHSAWSVSLEPIVSRRMPSFSILTHKASEENIKNFGNYLSLISQALTLLDDIDYSWLFLKHLILVAATLSLPCKTSAATAKNWSAIVSALNQSYQQFPNPNTKNLLLVAIHHSKAVYHTLHTELWNHIMDSLPLQTMNSTTRTISRLYRAMRPTSRNLPATAELASAFFCSAVYPTPAYWPKHHSLPAPLQVTPEAVWEVLLRLPLHTAPGHDGISYELLRLCPEQMANLLQPLFTQCSLQLTTPQEWSVANVLPLYKGKGQHKDPKSYRPISLLPTCRKVFELLLAPYVQQNTLKFHPSQFGFLPSHSLEMAVALSHDHATKYHLPSVLFDITKAFDSVDRNLLWRKLEDFTNPSLTALVRSMFLDCKAKILHPSEASDVYQVPNGVVQGSVLGPILFAIFVNDFPALSEGSLLTLFADDIRVSTSCPQEDTDTICSYIQKNHMEISIKKTKALGCSISINSTLLDPELSAVYLGFPLTTEGIDSATHLKKRIILARQALHKLVAVTPPTTSLRNCQLLLQQFVFPVLEFGLPLLDLSTRDYTKLNKFAVFCIYTLIPDLPTCPYPHAVLGAFGFLPYSIRVLYLRTRLHLRLQKSWNPLVHQWVNTQNTNPKSCWNRLFSSESVRRFASFVKAAEKPKEAYVEYQTTLWQNYLRQHTPFLLSVKPHIHSIVQVVDFPLLPFVIPPSPLNLTFDASELQLIATYLHQNSKFLYSLVKRLEK